VGYLVADTVLFTGTITSQRRGKGEKRKEGDGVCMHVVYIIIWDRVVDLI
jgi:hypothetical protein